MIYKIITSLFLLAFLSVPQAKSEYMSDNEGEYIPVGESKKISTITGTLEIKRVASNDNRIIFNGKNIKKTGSAYVSLEKKFSLKESTILLISIVDNGAHSTSSYFIIELFKNNKYIITPEMEPVSGFISYSFDNGKLLINLGKDSGFKKHATYKKGKLDIKKVKINKTSKADDGDCDYLYENVYIPFVKNNICSEDPLYAGVASIIQETFIIKNDPRLNFKQLINISKKDCKNKSPAMYSKFKSLICNAPRK